jgi:hypothetical protein
MSTFVTALEPSAVSLPAVSPQPPADWWYANVMLDAPGTPIEGATLIGIFCRFVGAFEETIQLLIPAGEGTPPLQFSTGRVPTGTITASEDKLDVRHGKSYFSGEHPDYQLHVEGTTTEGQQVESTFFYEADAEPDRVSWIGDQLKHFVVYRLTASGHVTIDGETYKATGVGYIEHAYGTFGWENGPTANGEGPRFASGWDWYWTPGLGEGQPVVQFASIALLGDDEASNLVSITADGKHFHHFTAAAVEPLEEREQEGIPYTHKLRVTDRNEHGQVDFTITRGGGARGHVIRSDEGPTLSFLTGNARIEGKASWDGVSYDLTGKAFGSAMRLVLPA